MIQYETIIKAEAREIWQVLTAFHAYETWNPIIEDVRVSGKLKVGKKIKMKFNPDYLKMHQMNRANMPKELQMAMEANGGEAHVISFYTKAKIEKMELDRRLSWRVNNMVYEAMHDFQIIPLDEQSCRFIYTSTMESWALGKMLGFVEKQAEKHGSEDFDMNRFIEGNMRVGGEMMSEAVKERAEQGLGYFDHELMEKREKNNLFNRQRKAWFLAIFATAFALYLFYFFR